MIENTRNIFLLLGLMTVTAGLFTGCKKDDDDGLSSDIDSAIEVYADIVYASYEDSYNTAADLKTAIDAFVASPSESGFQACKDAWLAARVPYGQTEAYRFYGGPIDDDDGPEGLINAWPMDENFIDYVDGNPDAGLINDPTTYPDITKQVLMDLNETISETSIFTGYHAIEFLLWGQDLSSSSAGVRPYTDYVTGGTAANQERRGTYLKVVADLLLDNLAEVRDEWAADGAFRAEFLSRTDGEALGNIFTALGELSKGELAGERMFVAFDSQDQEDEHSCFSDNTHVDIAQNYQGIKNIYFGTYTRVDGTKVEGTGFDDAAQKADSEKATAAEDAFAACDAALAVLPVPFDNAIAAQDQEVLDLIEALRDLSDRLTDVGFELGAEF